MILYIASGIIFLFVSFSLFFRTDCPLAVKICGIAIILLASLKYVIYNFLGGAFFSPDLPRLFIIAMEALYGSLLILFFLLLLWDLYLAGNWILAKTGIPIPTHLPRGIIKCGLVIIALGLGCFGTWEAIKVPDVRTVKLHIPGLPQNLAGFAIVQLSDLHVGPILKKDWLAEVVEKTNALEPDIIAITGDFIDGYVAELEDEVAPLARLKARYGVFGVTGNHEYYWNAREWSKTFQNLNVKMLENEHMILDVDGKQLVVAGIPDLAAARFGEPTPDIKKALENAPETVRILLAHQPKGGEDYSRYVDLQLSGHTHGGTAFFLKPLIARFNEGFVNGVYHPGGKTLYLSPGTGIWNGFSCRIGVPAEITKIILE